MLSSQTQLIVGKLFGALFEGGGGRLSLQTQLIVGKLFGPLFEWGGGRGKFILLTEI